MAKSEIAELIDVQRQTNALLQKLVNITLNISGNLNVIRENEGLPGLNIDIEDFVKLYNKFDSNKTRFNWLSVKFWRNIPRCSPEELEIDKMVKCNDLIQPKLEREKFARDLEQYKNTIKTKDQLFEKFASKDILRILGYLGRGKGAIQLSSDDRIKEVLANIKTFDFVKWKKEEYSVDPEKLAKYKKIHVFVEPKKEK